MNIDKTQTRRLIEDAIDKAREDETFKKALIKDPLIAIGSMLGTGEHFYFTAGKELIFIEKGETPQNTDSTYYINIATYGDLEDMELTQEQLETIAGGTDNMPLPFPWPIIMRF